MLPDSDLPPGTNQAFPLIRVAPDLAGEEDLDSSLQKVTGRRIAKAEGLRAGAAAMPVEPGREYTRVVEDHKITGPQQVGELTKPSVPQGSTVFVKVKQAGGAAFRQGFLGNQFFGQMIVEIRDQHASDYRFLKSGGVSRVKKRSGRAVLSSHRTRRPRRGIPRSSTEIYRLYGLCRPKFVR